MIEKTLEVPTVSCGHCKAAIEGAVGQLPGVEDVNVDLAAKQVTVQYDGGAVEHVAIVAAIEDAGYGVAPASASTSGGCCG